MLNLTPEYEIYAIKIVKHVLELAKYQIRKNTHTHTLNFHNIPIIIS